MKQSSRRLRVGPRRGRYPDSASPPFRRRPGRPVHHPYPRKPGYGEPSPLHRAGLDRPGRGYFEPERSARRHRGMAARTGHGRWLQRARPPRHAQWHYVALCRPRRDREYPSTAPSNTSTPKAGRTIYRIPKYMYYLWQANYVQIPLVFVHPHYWQTRYVGQKQDITVDSNCESVEL